MSLEGSSLKLRFTGLFYDFYFDVSGHLLWNNTGGEKKNDDTNNHNRHNPTGTTKTRQQVRKFYFEKNVDNSTSECCHVLPLFLPDTCLLYTSDAADE